MVDWADVIFVMELKHRDIVKQRFRTTDKKIAVLHIEDRYQFNDPELVRILQVSLSDWL